MEVIIQGTVSALGFLENGVYYQEPDCYETIRDLIRFLRNDNNVMLARRICGERNIIGNDLIPIIKSEDSKGKTFDIALRLLVNLIQPAIVSLQGKQPEDSEEWQKYWILEENLRKAKSSFADTKFFTVLKQRLEIYFLETAWDDRIEEERLVMERIIVLLRYVFAISHAEGDEKGIAEETNCHDRIINAFLDSGIQKVLVHIALQTKERDFHLSILSIFALIIEKHNPCDIVVAGRDRTIAEKEKSEEELRKIIEKEQARLSQQRKRMMANRHSKFSGSYVVKGLPAVNKENDLLVNKPIKSLSEISFLNERKNKKVIAKNRRPFEGKMRTHTSSLNLRMKLKVFIEELLSSCFNRLLKSTKELAFDSRLSFGQKDADLHFFLLMRFMLEYTRLSGRAFSEVSICLSVEAFHHVQVQISNYMESVVTMKKEAKHLGVRIQYSLSAYKELILFLQHVLDCGSSDEKDIAQRTLYHILIVEEYREMGLTMIRKFSPGFLSKTYLSELILSTHYYFRLLEKAVKTGRLNTVKKRSKIRRRTARRKKENVAPTSLPAVVDSLSPEDLSNKWSSIVKEIKDIVMGNLEFSSDQIPMNSLLDVQEEQHQKFAMLKVQRAMREGRTQDAMGLYRASRELWPTDGIFGDPNSSVDEQLVEIREIFFTDLKDVANELLNVELATQKKFSSDSMVEENDGRYYSDEEASEEDRFETKEVNFAFPEYVAKYARTDVLRWYVFLLNDFATNSFELNKALIKLLHRVAFDLNMPSRLFQLSLFRIFAQVGTHFKGMPKEDTKKNSLSELFTFGHHLLKKFFSCYGILGDKLAPEILFWKGPRECYEIQNGYGTYDASKNVKQVSAWSWDEELENELRSLYNEYRDMEERPEGMDLLDFIEPNLSRPRTRKQIFKKLKEFALDPLGAKAKKESITDRNFPIKQMKELIEEYNSIQGKEEDMVEFLRARLIGKQGEQFSRQKLIKQINHQGIVYEKKSTAKKSEWSELLKTELRGLKQQYDEMDEDDHELIDLVDYVMRRLSEKKPRRQVERELLALGVAINSRNKLKRIKGREVDQNTGTNEDYRNLGRQIDHKPGTNEDDGNLSSGRSDDSDAELELDIEEDCTSGGTNFMSSSVDDADKDDLIDSRISSAEKRNSIVPNDGDDEMENTNKESKTYESFLLSEGTNFESSSADTLCSYETTSSPIKSKGKRKRVLSTSDEDDNFEMESMDRVPPSSVSPTPLNKKKRVVVSDSDED